MQARADCSPANAWHAKSNTNPTDVISSFTFSPVIPGGEIRSHPKGVRGKVRQSFRNKIRSCIAFWFPRNEQGDNLSKAGWSWGCVSAVDFEGRTIWIADAHRGDGN